MNTLSLIYSGGGNKRFVDIALSHGFKYGAQLPDTVYGKLYFADQNWKNPNRKTYMKYLSMHKPYMATVLDLESRKQFKEVISWAEEASQYVEKIQIIPKVNGIIKNIPRTISGKEVILGYSIPTKYGKTSVSISEFRNWKVHLLGGSPNKQITYYSLISKSAKVISLDGNYFRFKATKFCEHWDISGKWIPDGGKTLHDAHYLAFEKSCLNISRYWDGIIKKQNDGL